MAAHELMKSTCLEEFTVAADNLATEIEASEEETLEFGKECLQAVVENLGKVRVVYASSACANTPTHQATKESDKNWRAATCAIRVLKAAYVKGERRFNSSQQSSMACAIQPGALTDEALVATGTDLLEAFTRIGKALESLPLPLSQDFLLYVRDACSFLIISIHGKEAASLKYKT
eukprot:GHVU01069479.1.p1 GENE.GHVU01069479.1~~GHVU01069479.1.p1  ORF type:complete len:176 (+),score=20.25 GHVU01069479.1:1924-2451(+)